MSDSKSGTGASATQQQQQQTQTSTKAAKKGSSSSSTTAPKATKAEAVLTATEIGRMVDLGLGRGVDSTNPKPWVNKSSFQVRRVTMENVIGTEEGGSLQSYEREVSSVQSQQTDLKSSIAVPQAPVSIGVDAELSRSFSTTRKAVGKKVINRTISFRADFEDAPQSRTTDPHVAKLQAASASYLHPSATSESGTSETDRLVSDAQNGLLTFEERLATWIMERVESRSELKDILSASEGRPIPQRVKEQKLSSSGNTIADLATVIQEGDEEDRKEIIRDCIDFVYHFRITHYVSAIELGAAEYRVLSEQEYYTKIGLVGSLGFEAIATSAVSQSASWKKTKKASDLKRLGLITGDGKVVRGTYNEAVVGVDIQPISSLVKLRYLQLALRKALLNYANEQGDESSGPFLISCCNDNIFWTVNTDRGYAVEGTRNIQNASLFYVAPIDDGDHPYEFNIGYYGDNRKVLRHTASTLTPTSKQVIEPVARYVDASVGLWGTNSGPLHLKFHLRESSSRLTLHSRVIKKSAPIDTAAWVTGREVFFINCARRRMKKDGYICMKLIRRHRQPEFITACVPSTHYHDDRNTFMLFRLLPSSYRENQTLKREETDQFISEQLDEYEGKPSLSGESRKVHFSEPTSVLGDTVQLLKPSPPGKRRLGTSGGTIVPVEEPITLPELSKRPTSDPTEITLTTDTHF